MAQHSHTHTPTHPHAHSPSATPAEAPASRFATLRHRSSMLMQPAAQRLAGAAALLVLLWAAVAWALAERAIA